MRGAKGALRRAGWGGVALMSAVLGAVLVAVGCGGSEPDADTVLRNGYVYTVDENDAVQQAVAVRDGRIVYVGSDQGANRFVGSRTQVIDLGGRMLMPGFVDGHLHPLAGGRALLLCNLNYAPLSRTQMQAAIQACLDDSSDKEPDTWLEVVNWVRQATQAIDADPDKSTLDALTTSRPILVRSSDFHTVLTNTRGLALAGVTKDTPDPAGGSFARDAQGNPTGICEDAAGWMVSAMIPPDTDEDRLAQGRAALAAMRLQGVTSFMDAASGEDQAKTFTALQQAGELTARAFLAPTISVEEAAASPADAVAAVKALAARYDQGTFQPAPGVSLRHVKMFGDGVVNAPADTGGLLAPYNTNAGTDTAPNWVPGTNLGSVYFAPEVWKPLMAEIAKSGLDPHVHATGERTVRQALDAYEYARQQVPGTSFRPVIAHNETVATADYARYQALGVMASFSFQWAQQAPYSVGETEAHLGPDRFARMEPFGSLHNAGARVGYGSDWPIDPFDEMLALKIGVTRSGDPESPNSFGPDFAGKINADPALSRADALRAITINSAWQLRLEQHVGSIERGKFADLIVLDKNFMQQPDEELARNQVLLTMVGGQVVMAKAPFGQTAGAAVTTASGRQRALNLRAANGHAVVPGAGHPHGDGHNH
ncbi:amidohydrolase [Ideonella sp.]|uniref:amidohydrolase n=1 Tax=Ideonella sp. TaxID=1929293 RepID=UPI002B4821D1|nr:amidohydrolase [Ideonella sp.]HJV70838.1 amidohydrolase [Ideonella sp.]